MTAPTDRAAALRKLSAKWYPVIGGDVCEWMHYQDALQSLIDEAVKAERERCAHLCDNARVIEFAKGMTDSGRICFDLAAAIRSAP